MLANIELYKNKPEKFISMSMRLTVETFQQLHSIGTLPMDDFDRAVKMIEILTGKTEHDILRLPVKKFSKFANRIAASFDLITQKLQFKKPKNAIKANGRWYRIHFDPTKEPFNAGRYCEVATFGNDPIMNLHKIMATLVNPMRWSWLKMRFVMLPYDATKHEQVAEDMLKADFAHAYHAAVFFYHVFKISMQISRDYLVAEKIQQGMTKETATQSIETLLSNLDGLPMPKWFPSLKLSL